MTMRTPCQKKRAKAFIAPTPHDSPANRSAIRLCETCPAIRDCAEAALTSGCTLKPGLAGPAQDVIQAGVVCRGDLTTAFALAAVAGVPVPDYQSMERTRRNSAPDECQHCENPMVKWGRYEVPEGYVMHYAHGFCTNCRSAYRAYKAENPSSRRVLPKVINRHGSSRPGPQSSASDDQPTLFSV